MLRTVTERSIERQKHVFVCFIDFEKAFDKVDFVTFLAVVGLSDVHYPDEEDVVLCAASNLTTGEGTR